MKHVAIFLALMASATGCSTWLNDTAPAPTEGYAYGAGARQTFLGTKATLWMCPTQAGGTKDCKRVKVSVR